MGDIFIGSEALASGAVGRYEPVSQYTRVLPNVYAPAQMQLTLYDRTVAAWLWSHREAVIAGMAAAKLHGVNWVDDNEPVELIWPNHRAPEGVITRRDTLHHGET